jgi:PTH1 family peptidyl-tRNA hydrolase
MKLIVGLGNPGPKYLNTRHNFGFMALNYFQDSTGAFADWLANDSFKSIISEGELNEEKVFLVKPQTMMNASGEAIRLLADFYQKPLNDLIVVHDDLDLTLGTLRVSFDASAAGHKGVSSVINCLGGQKFVRVRLGIKPPQTQEKQLLSFRLPETAEKFVLQKFSGQEEPLVKKTLEQAQKALLVLLKDGLETAQNQFN